MEGGGKWQGEWTDYGESLIGLTIEAHAHEATGVVQGTNSDLYYRKTTLKRWGKSRGQKISQEATDKKRYGKGLAEGWGGQSAHSKLSRR